MSPCGDHEFVKKLAESVPSIEKSLSQIIGGLKIAGFLFLFCAGLVSYTYLNDMSHGKEIHAQMMRQIEKNTITYEDLFIFKLEMRRELTGTVQYMPPTANVITPTNLNEG